MIVFEDRLSDSPFIERVWRSHSERPGTFRSVAASTFEMVLSRHGGRTFFTLRGPETQMTLADLPADGEWTIELGYPGSAVFTIGVIELVCLALYLVPATSVFGAILLVGYLGGAVATHVRVGHPLASHVLFPTYVAAMLWGGLYLREPRLRALLPFPR
jgi:hypothetical protein